MVLCMCVVAATAFQAPASKLGMSAVRASAAPAVRFSSAVVMDEFERSPLLPDVNKHRIVIARSALAKRQDASYTVHITCTLLTAE